MKRLYTSFMVILVLLTQPNPKTFADDDDNDSNVLSSGIVIVPRNDPDAAVTCIVHNLDEKRTVRAAVAIFRYGRVGITPVSNNETVLEPDGITSTTISQFSATDPNRFFCRVTITGGNTKMIRANLLVTVTSEEIPVVTIPLR